MDLYAYTQINRLEDIAKANGIDVPRLRGYRLMKDEQSVPEEVLQNIIKSETEDTLNRTARRVTDMIEDFDAEKLKAVRYDVGDLMDFLGRYFSFESRLRTQYEVWNKYAGRDDVLMIHSRIGGPTYTYTNKAGEEVTYDLRDQPWYLDYAQDAIDSTYVDIYAKITVEEER